MTNMILKACTFDTERLLVKEWHSHSASDWPHQDLAHVVMTTLTELVTRALPPSWQGTYSEERASRWIEERDDEDGATLLAIDKTTRQPVGLMILFESQSETEKGCIDVRLGYLLAEAAWGKGFATELVHGFVGWCRSQDSIESIAGGVESDNLASIRVLEKTGFQLVTSGIETAQDELLYQLNLR